MFNVDHPFCVSGGKIGSMDEDVKLVDSMQLVLDSGRQFDPGLIAQHLSLLGTLFHRISGGHTDVMIDVGSVRTVP